MGAIEPTTVCRESIQSRRGSRTDPTGACGRTRSGKGGSHAELLFARTETTRSARCDGIIQPTPCKRKQSGRGGGDTELTFARTESIWSRRGSDAAELPEDRTEASRSRAAGGRVEPTGNRTAPT